MYQIPPIHHRINVGQKKRSQDWRMDAVGFRHSSYACVRWNATVTFQILVSGSGGSWETTMVDDDATNTTIARGDDGRPGCATHMGLRKGSA